MNDGLFVWTIIILSLICLIIILEFIKRTREDKRIKNNDPIDYEYYKKLITGISILLVSEDNRVKMTNFKKKKSQSEYEEIDILKLEYYLNTCPLIQCSYNPITGYIEGDMEETEIKFKKFLKEIEENRS